MGTPLQLLPTAFTAAPHILQYQLCQTCPCVLLYVTFRRRRTMHVASHGRTPLTSSRSFHRCRLSSQPPSRSVWGAWQLDRAACSATPGGVRWHRCVSLITKTVCLGLKVRSMWGAWQLDRAACSATLGGARWHRCDMLITLLLLCHKWQLCLFYYWF
jgi:hypothetical protein